MIDGDNGGLISDISAPKFRSTVDLSDAISMGGVWPCPIVDADIIESSAVAFTFALRLPVSDVGLLSVVDDATRVRLA